MVLYAKTCSKQKKFVVILQTVCNFLAYSISLINKIIAVFTLDILLCCKYLVQIPFFFMNIKNLISLQSFEDGSTWNPLFISSTISCGHVCCMSVSNS